MAVDWLDLIQADLVILQKKFENKDEILEFLSAQLSQSPKLAKYKQNEILSALQEREGKGSTGLGGGIAVPHCGLKKAYGFTIVILSLTEGIDFGAFDSIPCNFIISIVGPEEERNQHVQILASLASGLQKAEEVQALLSCTEHEEAMAILGRIFAVDFRLGKGNLAVAADANTASDNTGGNGNNTAKESEYSRLTIFIQSEKFFAPLLEEAVRASGGSVAVIEGSNVAKFLQRMPLYAYVINDKKMNKFLRCIEAVIPNEEVDSVYGTIRRINKKIEKKAGVLVFHQEIHGLLGSLDYL